MNTAILLSGGVGNRLRSDVPKQYIEVGGRLMITYALKTLAESLYIDQILIVAQEVWQEAVMADADRNGVAVEKVIGFALPGFNRQASIINGMQKILPHTGADTVFIHDAARPLLSQGQIRDCFAALPGHDGVMPVLPMKDTVYLSRNRETVASLLDRSQLFAGQAPELFLFQKYYRANMALTRESLAQVHGSTEPAVLAGMNIAMIPGDENNFKVTTDADMERFRSIAGCSMAH